MYGVIGSFLALPGKRDDLMSLMTAGSGDMPGCLSYIVARDATDPDKIWVTEVWDSEHSHKASLDIPQVAETIDKAMPLIAGFGERFVTEPTAGTGL